MIWSWRKGTRFCLVAPTRSGFFMVYQRFGPSKVLQKKEAGASKGSQARMTWMTSPRRDGKGESRIWHKYEVRIAKWRWPRSVRPWFPIPMIWTTSCAEPELLDLTWICLVSRDSAATTWCPSLQGRFFVETEFHQPITTVLSPTVWR